MKTQKGDIFFRLPRKIFKRQKTLEHDKQEKTAPAYRQAIGDVSGMHHVTKQTNKYIPTGETATGFMGT